MARNIVTSSGGRIWFESEEGKGSTFFIEMPVFNEEMLKQ
jgi:signal transduction histidine kinase